MFLRLQGSQQEVVEFHDKVFFSKFQENFRTVAGHFKVSKRGKSLRFVYHKSVINIQKEPLQLPR